MAVARPWASQGQGLGDTWSTQMPRGSSGWGSLLGVSTTPGRRRGCRPWTALEERVCGAHSPSLTPSFEFLGSLTFRRGHYAVGRGIVVPASNHISPLHSPSFHRVFGKCLSTTSRPSRTDHPYEGPLPNTAGMS